MSGGKLRHRNTRELEDPEKGRETLDITVSTPDSMERRFPNGDKSTAPSRKHSLSLESQVPCFCVGLTRRKKAVAHAICSHTVVTEVAVAK